MIKNSRSSKNQEIEKILCEFGVKTPEVLGIYEGHNPGDKKQIAYYIVPCIKRYNEQLEDEITEISIRISREERTHPLILSWPVNPRDTKKYHFIKRRIYGAGEL